MIKRIMAAATLSICFSLFAMIVVDSMIRFSSSDWAWFLGLLVVIVAFLGSAVWAISVLIKPNDRRIPLRKSEGERSEPSPQKIH